MVEQLVNTYTIMMNTLPLVGEPTSRYSVLKAAMLSHCDFGYKQWCDKYGHPTFREQVTLDSAKTFALSSLTYAVKNKGIRKISLYDDGSADGNYLLQPRNEFLYVGDNNTSVVVPYAEANTAVWVWYYCRPGQLTEAENAADTSEATIPVLMPAEYREYLKFFIAAMYFRTERNQPGRAQYWEERFIMAVKDLEPNENPQENRIRNKYPRQPF